MAIRVILEDNRCGNHDDEMLHNIWTHIQLIHEQNKQIMETQAEVVQVLNQVSTQLTKVKGETSTLLDKVAALEAAAGNQPNVTPELRDAVNALKSQVQVVDDLVADTPTPPPVEDPAPPAEPEQPSL